MENIVEYVMSWFQPHDIEMLTRLCISVLIGSVIGMERSYRGRAAGLRTYVLVCLSATLMMLIPAYADKFEMISGNMVYMDPTRVMQGIATGIGFLGAGVIFRENLSIRGLTTAASIWLTSAIGILVGVGFIIEAVFGTILTFLVLAVFGRVSSVMPQRQYVKLVIMLDRNDADKIKELNDVLKEIGFSLTEVGYDLINKGSELKYNLKIHSTKKEYINSLNRKLLSLSYVKEYSVEPVSG